MAIPMPDQSGTPAGDFVNRQVLGETPALTIEGIAAAMVHAGWTSTPLGATNWLNVTGQPANNQTVTIDGSVYTVKTAINNGNPREVLIGATWRETMQALVHCINDSGAGKGTSYSSATSPHPTCRASYNGSQARVYISSIATGPTVTGILISETLNDAAFGGVINTRLYLGGYRLTSARTPDGHQVCADLRENATTVKYFFGDPYNLPGGHASAEYDGTYWNQEGLNLWYLELAPGRRFRVIASKYSVWVCVPGSAAIYTAFGATLVKVPDARMEPGVITGATGGGGGGPVTVAHVAHGMVGAGNVYIAGAEGLAINGVWNVTVLDENSYTLDGSETVPAGSYAASSARSANLAKGQISQAYFCWGGLYIVPFTPHYAGLRFDFTNPHWRVGRVNQYGWASATSDHRVGDWDIWFQTSLQWFDVRYWIQEAAAAMGQDHTSSQQGAGWLWAAFLLAKGIPGDTQATDSNGQRWFAYTMSPSVQASLMLAIPPEEN